MHASRGATEPALSARSYREHVTGGPNAHKHWFKARNHLDGPVLGPIRSAQLPRHLCGHAPPVALPEVVDFPVPGDATSTT